MHQLLNMMVWTTSGVALVAPLLYAIETLRGMRHKKMYPLLRCKERDCVNTVIVPMANHV